MKYLIDLKRLFAFRSMVVDTALMDVRQRFAGSVFGAAWTVLFPIMQLSIYGMLYAVIFKIRPSGLTEYEYVLLVFSGLVPLFIFNDVLSSATASLAANKNLLVNTTFPVELIPVRAALAAQVPSLVGLMVTLLMGYFLGRTGWLALIGVPILWVLLVMFAVGLGWILSLITLIAKDVQHGLGLVVMTLMFLSPFAYTPDMVPDGLRAIIHLNPLTYFVIPFQQLLCYDSVPPLGILAGTVGISVVVFLYGFIRFQTSKYLFLDYA